MVAKRNFRDGIVLVVVTSIVASLSVLAFGLAYRSRIAIKQTELLIEGLQQEQIAFAACVQACAILADDDEGTDCFEDLWHGWNEIVPADMPGRWSAAKKSPWQVKWKLTDESGKINLNSAPPELLLGLACLDGAVVASILDWIDEDDVPNPDGAESDYYSALKPGYKCRNAPIDNIDELLLVKGLSAQTFFGSNLAEIGEHELQADYDATELQVGTLPSHTYGLCDLLTTYGDGRININTACRLVLDSIPLLCDSAVSEIMSAQQDGLRKFSSMDDIQNNDRFTAVDKLVLGSVAKFSSNHFQLDVKVRKQGCRCWCEYAAIIERQGGGTRVLSWRRKTKAVLKNLQDIGQFEQPSIKMAGL